MAVWSGEASVTLAPTDQADADGAFLSGCRAADGSVTGTFFEAGGLLVDLQNTGDVVGALGSHSGFTAFGALFGEPDGSGCGGLAEVLDGSITAAGSHVVLIGHVVLAPAWRGSGGVGRLLTSRLLQWLCAEPRLIAVAPFVSTPGAAPHRARRTWASLGFRPYDNGIWILDPATSDHDDALFGLEARLLGRAGFGRGPLWTDEELSEPTGGSRSGSEARGLSPAVVRSVRSPR
ncbi:GNAT family N-acetyltransferase [Amycolatopsis sp. NPDC051903]|uniref:GNAT family N-acetyltransferase n=1 Tax=Amycolatopsis sp. NPDC051903 TaxID=3363936 RepID=UPI0037A9AB0E